MKVKGESEDAQLYLTLSDPMDCSPPGSSVHGIFHTRALEWGAMPSPIVKPTDIYSQHWLLTEMILSPRKHLAMLGDSFACDNQWRCATSISWVEARGAANTTMNKTAPPNK